MFILSTGNTRSMLVQLPGSIIPPVGLVDNIHHVLPSTTRGLQHNSTVIYITPGNYILEYQEETQLRYKSQSVTAGSDINLYFIEVLLSENIAYLGSACYFTNGIDFTQSGTVQITNSSFSNNREDFATGTFYSNSVPTSFNDNSESAIEVHGSVITINPDTKTNFTGNSGSYGGAIALYECSYIVLYNETKLAFINNIAHHSGGAIYSGLCNSQQTHYFIVYYNSNVHMMNWKLKWFSLIIKN